MVPINVLLLSQHINTAFRPQGYVNDFLLVEQAPPLPSFSLPLSFPPFFSLPFSLKIRPATPPSDFFHFPLLLFSFLFHIVSSALSFPADVSCPARSGAEPHPKSNLVHFSFKICHLVAGYAVGLQYAVKKHWKGRMCSLPCQSCSWYRATALPASYVPVPLSGPRREFKKSPRIVSQK